jgi:hypothetical protein
LFIRPARLRVGMASSPLLGAHPTRTRMPRANLDLTHSGPIPLAPHDVFPLPAAGYVVLTLPLVVTVTSRTRAPPARRVGER